MLDETTTIQPNDEDGDEDGEEEASEEESAK